MPVRTLATITAALLVAGAITASAGPVLSATESTDEGPVGQEEQGAGLVVDRHFGANRIETATAISAETYPTGADAAVVARDDEFADALAGGPLAGATDGPVLLTDGDSLSQATRDELVRLAPDTVYLLGGDAALEPDVDEAIGALLGDARLERLAGDDRFATAAAVAEELASVAGAELAEHAYVAQGISEDPHRGWPDPLAVGALAAHEQAPILLAHADDAPSETVAALAALDIDETVLVGGEAALASSVEDELTSAGMAVSRLAGEDRYATSAAVADRAVEAGLDPSGVWLATGNNWPDGLTTGPAAAAAGQPMLLIDGDDLRGLDAPRRWLAEHAEVLERVTATGGEAAISAAVLSALTEPDEDKVRGAWVHLFDDSLKSRDSIEQVVDQLADAGANTIFAQVARRHDAYYASDVLPATPDPNLEAGLDVVAALTEEAHAAGLEVHAWVTVAPTYHGTYDGLPVPDGWLAAEHGQRAPVDDRWVTRTVEGTWGEYLDPALPEVQEHVADVVAELAERYPIDGVHLDYVRYQSERHGYHPDALARYRDETGATGTPAPGDEDWSDWRREQTRTVMEAARDAIVATGADVDLSAATMARAAAPADAPDGFEATAAYAQHFQDWQAWVADGLVDAVAPMTYFRDHDTGQAAAFDGWVAFQGRLAATSESAVIPGVGAWLNAPEAVLDQVRSATSVADGAVVYSYQQPYNADRVEADSPDVWEELGRAGWGR